MPSYAKLEGKHFNQACKLTAASAILLACLSAIAQKLPDGCDRLQPVSVPEGDRPTLADAKSAGVKVELAQLPESARRAPDPSTGCSGIALYYGNVPGHFVKARSCVLSQLGIFRKDVTEAEAKAAQRIAAGGAAEPSDADGLVLAMLYGNGEGVRRNLPLAGTFICQYSEGIESAPASQHLQEFRKIIARGGQFDVCAEGGVSFGRSTNYICLGLEQERVARETDRAEAAVLAVSTPTLKASFLDLRSTWRQFHQAYGEMEDRLCDGGTGCGPITESDDLMLMRSWLAGLQSIRNGSPPALRFKASDFLKLDADLNAQYRGKLDEVKDCGDHPCIGPSIRIADRAWMKYREAWVRFGKLRWPAVPADEWRAWLTTEWIALLTGT
ncbi:MAG TPA: hypothetical protein VGD64_07500 [Acidisarcina sp.]